MGCTNSKKYSKTHNNNNILCLTGSTTGLTIDIPSPRDRSSSSSNHSPIPSTIDFEDEFFRLSIDTFDTSGGRSYSQEYYDPSLLESADDYEILALLQEGASGKVYHGKRKDGVEVALKFFGYSTEYPELSHVYHELQTMSQFTGISGVVQLLGYFPDTQEGLLPNRLSPFPFPVIVMELLSGGEVFNKIYKDKVVESERDISILFRRIVLAVQSIHENKYIHRDLKLENMMFLDVYENSPVKIIDMGSTVTISNCPDCIFRDCVVVGTPGYIAPESVQYFDYSSASDIWQLGCCLYSMLSGHSPFGSDIHSARYLPMSGVAWNDISSEAKDLVRRMLNKNVKSRITISEILSHSWIVSEKLSTCLLSEDYYRRMKYLALRQHMKLFFLDAKIIQSNRDRRKKLKKLIPLLHQSSSLSSFNSQFSFSSSEKSAPVQNMKPSQSTPCLLSPSIFIKRHSSIASVDVSGRESSSSLSLRVIDQLKRFQSSPIKTMSSEKLETRLESFRSAMLDSFSNTCESMTYDSFRRLLINSELSELATKRVFNIFDLDRTGMIDVKDFLLTMAALNFGKGSSRRMNNLSSASSELLTPMSDTKLNESNHSLAQLYFSIFDISGRGYIELDQMKLAIDYILYHDDEELGPRKFDTMSPRKSRDEIFDVEMLFAMIDTDGDGKIDFEKFAIFFNQLRASTI